jgi:formylmethanofuran dehydrogenase subunit A
MADKWILRMRILPLLFASFLPAAAIAQPFPKQAPDRTWITDVHIVSPEKLDHIEKGSVLIENGRIVRVERKTGAKKPAGATVVSGEGQFLIPGLIDSHVHLASIPGIRPEVNFGPAEAKPTWIKEYFKQLPRSYLYFGYTTLVDLAVVDRRVLEDFRQAPLHPDLFV